MLEDVGVLGAGDCGAERIGLNRRCAPGRITYIAQRGAKAWVATDGPHRSTNNNIVIAATANRERPLALRLWYEWLRSPVGVHPED